MTDKLSFKAKLLKNTAANYLVRLWSCGVAFFLFPFIVHHIGVAAAGVWLLVHSLTGYFGILNLGIDPSLTKYIARYEAQKDVEKIGQSINTAFFTYLGIGLLAAMGLFIIAYFFISLFNIPDKLVQEAKTVLYIAAATVLLGLPMGTFAAVLRGLQRYDIPALIDFGASIPKVVLIILLLSRGYGLVTLMLISSGSAALGWFLNAAYTKKLLPYVRITPSLFTREMVRILFSLAVSVFIIGICMIVIYPTDRLIIGAFLSVQLIVFYEAAYRIYQFITMIPQLLASAVIPAASELDTMRDLQSLKSLFLRGTKYTMAFFLALAIPTLFLSKHILMYWMGNDFTPCYPLVVILILHLFFNYNHLFAYYLLVGMNRIRFALWYYVGSAVLNLVLSIILVKEIGLIGVILGTAIPYVIFEPVFMWYVLREFDVKLMTYVKEVLIRTYPQACIIALSLYLLGIYYLPHSLAEALVYVLLSVGAYIVLFYFSGIESTERRDLIATTRTLATGNQDTLANTVIVQ